LVIKNVSKTKQFNLNDKIGRNLFQKISCCILFIIIVVIFGNLYMTRWCGWGVGYSTITLLQILHDVCVCERIFKISQYL